MHVKVLTMVVTAWPGLALPAEDAETEAGAVSRSRLATLCRLMVRFVMLAAVALGLSLWLMGRTASAQPFPSSAPEALPAHPAAARPATGVLEAGVGALAAVPALHDTRVAALPRIAGTAAAVRDVISGAVDQVPPAVARAGAVPAALPVAAPAVSQRIPPAAPQLAGPVAGLIAATMSSVGDGPATATPVAATQGALAVALGLPAARRS